MNLLQFIKQQVPKIGDRPTHTWKQRKHQDGTISVRCCNGTKDIDPCPEVNAPYGYELVNSTCLEDDERSTRWEWVFNKVESKTK